MRYTLGLLFTLIVLPALAEYSGPSAPVPFIAAGAVSARAPVDRAADFMTPKDFGGYGDVLQSTAVLTATANQCAITVGGGSFSSADVGKVFDSSGLGATYGYGGVASIAISSPGTGYTAPPTVAVSGGSGGSFQAEMAVLSATVAAGGTGYSTGTLSVAGAIPGTFATFSISQSSGVITGVTLLTGGEYLYVPGTSAVATTSTDSGTGATLNLTWGIGAINVVSPGVGYPTSGAAATLSGGLGGGAVATAALTGNAVSSTITVANGGQGYSSAPTATFVGGDGTGAAAGAVTVSGGAITGVALSASGTGFTSNPPAVIFTPAAPGSPATLGAVSVTPYVAALSTTIASVQSATGITLTACPSSSSSVSQSIAWGHDDTAAVQAALNTGRAYFNAQFLVKSSVTLNNGVLYGQSNAQSGLIGSVAMPLSSPILIGSNIDTMRDFEVQYDGPSITDQETAGQRVAISGSAGPSALQKGSQLSNLLVTHVGTAMFASGSSSILSVAFNSWRISDWSYRGFDISSSNRTGSVYQNIHISLGRANADRGFSLSGFASEERLDQINVEQSILNIAMYLGQIKGLSVGAIHIEGDQQRNGGTGYVKIEDTSGNIDALSFFNTRMAQFSPMSLELGNSVANAVTNWSTNRLQINALQAEGLNAPNASKYPTYPANGLTGVYSPMLIGRTPAASGYYTLAVNSYVWDSYLTASAALNANPVINSAGQISYERFVTLNYQLPSGAAAANFGATSCNAIGASACVTPASGPLLYTDIQNYGSGAKVGGNEALIQSSNDQSSAFLSFGKTRSTVHGAGPGTPVQPGDGLSEINAIADDGMSFHDSATDNFSVDDTVSTGIVPTNHQIWIGNTSGTHTLATLSDSRGNFYLRNGNLGIGSHFGYNPPAVYSSGLPPQYPISISNGNAGTQIGIWYGGSSGGGAQINAWNGFTSTQPIYGFWFNSNTGLGNPAAGVTSVVTNGAESWRMDAVRHQSFSAATQPTFNSCGTSPSIDANATDNSGTITVGAGPVSTCILGFTHAYTSFNHCRVSPHNLSLASASYSYTLSGLTVTATNLSSQVIDYTCDGQ